MRNELVDLIPKLMPRPGFESQIRRVAAAGNVLDDVPGGASYNTAVEFVVDAAIEHGWIKQFLDVLVGEYPNRTELVAIRKAFARRSGVRGLWSNRALPGKLSIVAFVAASVLITVAVVSALLVDQPTPATLMVLRIVGSLGAAGLVAAVAAIATRKLAPLHCVIVMGSAALVAGVAMLLWDPVRSLVEGPRPVIAIVRPDVNARAMMSPSRPSPYVISVGGKSAIVPAAGVALGIGEIPPAVMATYRQEVKQGEPTRLFVRLRRGTLTKVEVTYKGRPCKPLTIDPGAKAIWEFGWNDCVSPSPPP